MSPINKNFQYNSYQVKYLQLDLSFHSLLTDEATILHTLKHL